MESYDASEHRKTMYAHFGATIYLLNCFEHGLAIGLMIADFMTSQRKKMLEGQRFDRRKYEEEFDLFFEQQFAQTTGNLIHRMRKAFPIPPELDAKMSKAKGRRDFLTHHFFRERAEEILTRSGLDKMIAELERDQELFKEVDEELQSVLAVTRSKFGIRDEDVHAHFQEMLIKVGDSDS